MESLRNSQFRALTSREVALQTVFDVLAVHPDTVTVALLENRRDRHGLAMPVEGPDPGPEAMHLLDDLLLKAAGDDPGCRLVLASVRPDGSDVVEEADIEHWRRLRAAHEGRHLELLDWILLAGKSSVLSLAEIAGPPAGW